MLVGSLPNVISGPLESKTDYLVFSTSLTKDYHGFLSRNGQSSTFCDTDNNL